MEKSACDRDPKTSKACGYPKSYRPISLLSIPYKILERLIYARVEPLIDPLLHKEQTGFRRGKSTVDQVVLLTQNIEDSFEAIRKAGSVFVNLTAVYDTVWHRGLTCKLLRLLPDKNMVKMIMELVRNRSFTLTTGDSKQSRLRRFESGVPQETVLAPLLFNIYTYDLPSMISRKFDYAYDGLQQRQDFTVLSNPYISWGKTGQIANVLSPFSGIAQKIILARHTAEATRGLGMGCWC